jgi:hypothetical protein
MLLQGSLSLLLLPPTVLGFMPPLSRPTRLMPPLSRPTRRAVSVGGRDVQSAQPLLRNARLEGRARMTGAPPSEEDDVAPVPLSLLRTAAGIGALLALFTVNQWSRSIIFYLVDFTDRSSLGPEALAEASRLFMNVDLGFDQACEAPPPPPAPRARPPRSRAPPRRRARSSPPI